MFDPNYPKRMRGNDYFKINKFMKFKSANLISIAFEKNNKMQFPLKDKRLEKKMVLLSGDQIDQVSSVN